MVREVVFKLLPKSDVIFENLTFVIYSEFDKKLFLK